MSDGTGIEWTQATWNPVTGCTKLSPASPGCEHCYAATFAERFRGTPGHYFERGFDVQLRPDKLDLPLRWRRPRRIFVNSMSDLFHDSIPDEYIARVWAVMAFAHRHTFQILTKRHGRMRSLLSSDRFLDLFDREYCAIPDWNERWPDPDYVPGDRVTHLGDGPLTNVWGGVSVENQAAAELRIPALMKTPLAVRIISAEPLLGPVDLGRWTRPHSAECLTNEDLWCSCDRGLDGYLDWVIVGGESGPGARPMHPAWARSLRDQCVEAGVPYLFKQAGSVLAREWGCNGKGTNPDEWPEPFPREYPNAG